MELRDFRKQLVAATKACRRVHPKGTFEGVDLESESQ
jgi:hypothetical protein